MTLTFNDTSTELGLCQEIDSICNSDTSSYPLKRKTRRLNAALDDYIALVLQVDKPHQIDDKNITSIPIATFDVVSGQRSYGFSEDQGGNEILKIHKVFIKDASSGNFIELKPTDIQEKETLEMYLDNSNQPQGIPSKYDWFAGSIFFDPIPNYASTAGAKIIYQRTNSYFVSTDTTKEPGIPGIHHEYLARKASLPFLIEKGLPQARDIKILIGEDEKKIKEYYRVRSADQGNAHIETARTYSR